MKISNFKQKGSQITFTVQGIDASLANTLRRVIISEIPIMAIEKVTFYDNSSALNDEVLAFRLGLLPLKTDLKTYNFISECTCKGKGCAKCTAILTMDLKGPKTVYASELKSTDAEIVPVYPSTPLVKITERQRVKFEATAQLGIGREHIKWQGGLASYEKVKDDKFNFIIESYGQLTPKELISAAFDVFSKKITEVKSIK